MLDFIKKYSKFLNGFVQAQNRLVKLVKIRLNPLVLHSCGVQNLHCADSLLEISDIEPAISYQSAFNYSQ